MRIEPLLRTVIFVAGKGSSEFENFEMYQDNLKTPIARKAGSKP